MIFCPISQGVSAISVVELAYFFTMRVFFNQKMKRTEY